MEFRISNLDKPWQFHILEKDLGKKFQLQQFIR